MAKNPQRAGENLNEITRGTPCKVEKFTKMANLAKIRRGFGKYSFWTPRVAPLRLAIITKIVRAPAKVLIKILITWQRARPLKMANVGKIRQGLNYMSNKMAKGLPQKWRI